MKDYGVCLHTFGPTMSLIVNLYERGIITDEDTDGFELKGDVATAFKLIEMVAFKQGIGKILAGGTSAVIKRFGGKQYTQDIKGLTIQKDPRPGGLDPSMFEQLTNPEGGVMAPAHLVVGHQINTFSKMKKVCKTLAVPSKTTQKLLADSARNLARLTPYDENFFAILNCLDLCVYYHTPLQSLNYPLMAELISAVTGNTITSEDLQETADRIWTLYRAINVREGQNRKDDQPPSQWFEPYTNETGESVYLKTFTGKHRLTLEDLNQYLDDYYEERGWEKKRGIPSEKKLANLKLDFVIKDFHQLGIF
jgi:aldehyde:ferredoxin oxidoreductase